MDFIVIMEELDIGPMAVRHSDMINAMIAHISWNLGDVSNDQSDSMPSETNLIRFCGDMVRHFYQNLGKQPFVEFSGSNLSRLDRVIPLMQVLRELGAKTGIYIRQDLPLEFWSASKPYLNHACIAFQVGQDDVDNLIACLNTASDRVDIHVNIEFPADLLIEAMRIAKTVAGKCKDITLGLKLHPGQEELDPTKAAQLTGANALVKRIAYKSRTRIHQNYRGPMQVVYPDRVETMTPSEIITKKLNQWQDWTCHAGLEMIVINSHGDVARGWCRQGGKIGNIRDVIVRFPTKPITCGAVSCDSPVDVNCTKTWY